MMAGPALQCVDLIRADGTPVSGLVPVDPDKSKERPRGIDEQAAVFDAAAFEHVDYVFFRRFSDGRSSQVAAYVVDNSDERLDKPALASLHHELWLHGTAPLLYVAWPSHVDVLTCARGPDFWDGNDYRFKPADRILAEAVKTAGAVDAELKKRAQFSAFRLADGTFWDDPRNSRLAKHDKAAHRSLIQAVVEADADLGGDASPVMRRLLLLMVLVKYLEDRRVFPANWFGGFCKGAKGFFEVLRAGDPDEVKRLLACLERKFNGDVFVLPIDKGHKLTSTSLRRFADLVEARTLKRQRYLWQQFSFNHLPVEVISHLYQRFVQGGHGTVYTPPFLASLLLDQAMPYERLTGTERVLDPACGSGVFLVGAFRRLINAWRGRNGWRRPKVDTLKGVLRRSIFGVDLDRDAIDLTAFSLALAVCDALKPDVIWSELRFDPLRDANLFEADFFELVEDLRSGSSSILGGGFDVVVGNPPFESELTEPGRRVNEAAEKDKDGRGTLPDKQASYLFLEQSLRLLRPNSRVCLLQPSGFLHNRKAGAFRQYVFRSNRVDAILDFTSIRKLFEKDPKTVAVCAGSDRPKRDHSVNHWTFRRTFSVHERIAFELDHYDRHRVAQQRAESDPFVWRVDLLGGGRLLDVSERFRAIQTLEEYVKGQKWDYGEGFVAAKSGRREPAPFLTGKPFLPTDALTESGVDESRIGSVTETHFRSAYTEKRFSAPLVLIKELQTLPITFWDKGPLAYRDKIIGVHSDPAEVAALREFYKTFRRRHSTYQFCCLLNGSQLLVGKSTAILKQDVDSLPYPKDARDLLFTSWEEVLRDDVLNYMGEYVRRGQNSRLLKESAGADDLRAYSTVFCQMLGSVYDNLRAHSPIFLGALTCQAFFFGDAPDVSWLAESGEDALRRLLYEENHECLRTVRVLRFYADNVLLIVKPDRLRYWIRSTAIRDADETLVDLRKQGY